MPGGSSIWKELGVGPTIPETEKVASCQARIRRGTNGTEGGEGRKLPSENSAWDGKMRQEGKHNPRKNGLLKMGALLEEPLREVKNLCAK